MRIKITTFLVALLTLTACRSHVDTDGIVIDGLEVRSANSLSFTVPVGVFDDAVEHTTITAIEYPTLEDVDLATLELTKTSFKGSVGDAYLIYAPREHIFLVKPTEISPESLGTLSREVICNALPIEDLVVTGIGRLVHSSDGVNKSILRVNFQLTDPMGVVNTFQGYISLTAVGDVTHLYLTGIKQASEEQLKLLFSCARSVSEGVAS